MPTTRWVTQKPSTGALRSAIGAFLIALLASTSALAAPEVFRKEVISRVFTINRIYKPMTGPTESQKVFLGDRNAPVDLYWIVGYRVSIVGPDGVTPMSGEYVCHNNVDYEPNVQKEALGAPDRFARLFTITGGHFETVFPKGFGVPFLSNEPLTLWPQVLNMNELEHPIEVRHKMTIEYVRDRDLDTPMIPLWMAPAQGLVLIEGNNHHYGLSGPAKPDTTMHGPGCSLGTLPPNSIQAMQKDDTGSTFAYHWVVPPGRQVNHSVVTRWLNLPFDTTVHYIACHLHPFAESLELHDLTAKKTVWKARVKLRTDRIGIESIEHFSSEKGIKLYKNHEYETISIYNNTTDVDQDAMASMMLYVRDMNFKKPQWLLEREKTAGK